MITSLTGAPASAPVADRHYPHPRPGPPQPLPRRGRGGARGERHRGPAHAPRARGANAGTLKPGHEQRPSRSRATRPAASTRPRWRGRSTSSEPTSSMPTISIPCSAGARWPRPARGSADRSAPAQLPPLLRHRCGLPRRCRRAFPAAGGTRARGAVSLPRIDGRGDRLRRRSGAAAAGPSSNTPTGSSPSARPRPAGCSSSGCPVTASRPWSMSSPADSFARALRRRRRAATHWPAVGWCEEKGMDTAIAAARAAGRAAGDRRNRTRSGSAASSWPRAPRCASPAGWPPRHWPTLRAGAGGGPRALALGGGVSLRGARGAWPAACPCWAATSAACRSWSGRRRCSPARDVDRLG